MPNLTDKQITALFANFINKAVIHKDAGIEQSMKQKLLIDEAQKAQFVANLEQPEFFALWGSINK